MRNAVGTESGEDQSQRGQWASAQTVLHEILQALVRMFAPILAHTTEEVWEHLPGDKAEREASVHLALWPEPVRQASAFAEATADRQGRPSDGQAEPRWTRIWKIREEVYRELEKLRASKTIGKSLEARVTLSTKDPETLETMRWLGDGLAEVLIVSEATVREEEGPPVRVEKSPHPKCARCWNLRSSVGDSTAHPAICARCIAVVKKR